MLTLQREKLKNNYKNLNDYLKSLDLKLVLFTDNDLYIPRMAQMTQKTNQFNLTTKRYTETDIKKFTTSDEYKVFAFETVDKFGSYGITGLSIIKINPAEQKANIDTFLLSCRIIGRNLEFVFLNILVKYLKKSNIRTITATYVKTLKNEQVMNFYENSGFRVTNQNNKIKKYELSVKNYKPKNFNYTEVTYGK
ncbi:MAG: GNAT family N-acetyltransferase [Elusimicrobia bacterium]|nr:GNAT family N-acetyltransferase [Elusimicrobiota bacterium]